MSNIQKVKKMIKEAILREVKSAWNGRFENLDKILSQNYDSMKESDKNLKDNLFRSYYRYYNDGDVIAFPAATLKKIGCDPEAIKILSRDRNYVKNAKSPIKYKDYSSNPPRWNYRYPSTKDNQVVQEYEQAMEKAILATFKYFKQKYPNFFNAEGRKKTIQQWKTEVLKTAQRNPTELDTYWVGEFGKQFGKSELSKYLDQRRNEKIYKITDPDEISKVINIMLKSIKGN